MSESPGASEPRSQSRRNSLVMLALQVIAGVVLGLSLAKAMELPDEQAALIGTLITLVTWAADETMKLPSKETRRGALIHGGLRFLSLAGFIMALQSLLVLNGWNVGS